MFLVENCCGSPEIKDLGDNMCGFNSDLLVFCIGLIWLAVVDGIWKDLLCGYFDVKLLVVWVMCRGDHFAVSI